MIDFNKVANDYLNSKIKLGFIKCYCQNLPLSEILNKQFTDASNAKICYEWFQEKTIVLVFPSIIAFFIVIINFIFHGIFRGKLDYFNISNYLIKLWQNLKNIKIFHQN